MPTASATIATLIRRYRVARGWTQDELGQRAGVSMRTISDIERGLSRYPHRDTIQQLLTAFALQGAAALEFQQVARSAHESSVIPVMLPHVPQPVTAFVGRATDIRAAQRTLAMHQNHLLTLVGPAGVGKTRLMIEIARTNAVAGSSSNAATWFFVDVTQATTMAEVIGELIRQLGISDPTEYTAMTILDHWLQQRRCSLILDNFEQAMAATALVERLLATHQLLTLCITSRIPLKITAETVQEVAPFAIADHRQVPYAVLRHEAALLIFESVAQTVQPDFTLTATNSALVARICTRLDGLPLGIELAAAQIARYTLTDLVRQLGRLSGTMVPNFVMPLVAGRSAHQQSLANAITWSYDLLDARIQILFRRLCVFAGEFDMAAAQAICDRNGTLGIDSIDGIALLLDHHLVQSVALTDHTSPPRFTLLAVIRDFGRELLEKRGEITPLRQQHAHYFADLLRQHEADFVGELQEQRLTSLTRDYDNILAALRQAREQQDVLLGADLASSLWWYWEKRRTLTEGREWMDHIISQIAVYRQPIDAAILGRMYYGAAVLANAQGDWISAQHYGQLCLSNCVATNDQGRIGQAHTLLGTIATTANDMVTALNEYEQALAVLRTCDSPRQLVPILNNLSALAIEQGDFAHARILLAESLTVKRQLGDQRGIAVSLINLSEWRKQQGEYAEALADIAEAEQIFMALGDQAGMAMAANNAGEVALARHDPTNALVALLRSRALFQRSESRSGSALVNRNIGDAYDARGDKQAAAQAWQASLLAQPTGTNADHCRAMLAM